MKINGNYQKLEENYLFTEIALRTKKFCAANPDAPVIKLGIGDVTLPLPEIAADAIIKAFEELKHRETFRGYGPELGYGFTKAAVVDYYKNYGVELAMDEVTIGDGIGSDIANVTDLFEKGANTVLVPDPVYPLYKATSLMDGQKIVYLPCTAENSFTPAPPDCPSDMVYLCSPNNPTGATFDFEQLQQWVDYANDCSAVILYDNAYERFIEENDKPHSIFQIKGAETCAIEFGSLSKTAGFTCVRSGYTVVPMGLKANGISLNRMWQQRQTTKYNGAPYPQQRGLVAALSPEGMLQADKNIAEYKKNSALIANVLQEKGIFYSGGTNSPYIWFRCSNGMNSWAFFDFLLNEANVVGTPGVGFGACGENYFRLTTFNTYENTEEAMERIRLIIS
ncbi:MAG: LL-diaminopimelate aminotransferase [Prevotellaceae bacterium]|jgi:LL-diaminopimelate aminotransferase|nr:LL-diaminopimelate aminotransferase [Prevotellaceae bacterium]